MKVVLLAAGFGSRLWPLSTSEKPKQFQQLLGDQSLLQYSHGFFAKLAEPDELYVLTRKGLERWVFEQLPELAHDHVLIVPDRRNTLPHTIFALKHIASSPEEPVLFAGTDIFANDPAEFTAAIQTAMQQAKPGAITFVASSAERPDTNAGYVQADQAGVVSAFIEKPDEATIQERSQTGPFYKTMFTHILSESALRQALHDADTDIASQAIHLMDTPLEHFEETFLSLPFCDISNAAFAYATNLHVVPTNTDFHDLGSFATLYTISDKDYYGNVVHGNVILDGDCSGNVIINQLDQPLVVIDAKDSVIIQTDHGSLCAPLAESNRVGEIYKQQIHIHE